MYKNRAICDVLSTIFWGWLSWIASSTRVVWRRIDLRKKLERSMCGDTLKAYVFTGSNELAGFDSVVNKSSQTIQCILKRYNVLKKHSNWILSIDCEGFQNALWHLCCHCSTGFFPQKLLVVSFDSPKKYSSIFVCIRRMFHSKFNLVRRINKALNNSFVLTRATFCDKQT